MEKEGRPSSELKMARDIRLDYAIIPRCSTASGRIFLEKEQLNTAAVTKLIKDCSDLGAPSDRF
jgi:hypothetical protein